MLQDLPFDEFSKECQSSTFLSIVTSKMGAGCCCCSKKNQRISSEYRSIPQYTPIGMKTNDPLILIDGYLDEPILSLEEALEPFYGEINHLSHYIKEAKTQCHYPSEHNLTLDESAAIYIYTMQWNDSCLYDHLQTALNSNDRSTIEPWFAYLKLFKNALDKLPTVKAEVWQGEPFDEELKEQLNSKSLPFYTSLCSCSLSINEIKKYGQQTMGKKIILVGYQSVNGKLVTDYTANDLDEAIVWPGIKLGVSKYIVTDAYHLWVLHPARQIEFSKIAAQGHQTIDHRTATLLLGKLGFDVKNSQVSDLLNDVDMLSDGYIDQDSMLSILDKLLDNRPEPEPIPVIDNEP
ncbi:unnamed protein product, partial [Rotaria sordida]